jgi:hypothetical protein
MVFEGPPASPQYSLSLAPEIDKGRVRKRARTDLCGGRSAIVVPTGGKIRTKETAIGGFVRQAAAPHRGAD